MLIFTWLIHSASRGFPQWVELHYTSYDIDKLHPPWPLPPGVSGQRPVSRVLAAVAGVARAGEGGPRGKRRDAREGGPRGKRRDAILKKTCGSWASANPSPPLPLCPAAGQRGRGGVLLSVLPSTGCAKSSGPLAVSLPRLPVVDCQAVNSLRRDPCWPSNTVEGNTRPPIHG